MVGVVAGSGPIYEELMAANDGKGSCGFMIRMKIAMFLDGKVKICHGTNVNLKCFSFFHD